MPIAATYDPATEKLIPTGGTSGTPHSHANMCQLDEDGSVELLAAVGPAAGITLDYQIRPGHQGAQILEVVLDSTNAAGGDTVDFYGRDTFGCSLSENVDVSAGNGTYYTTARFSEMHHVDCTGFADAVGTITINQNQWGVVLPRLGPELIEDGSFWDGTGWVIEAVWTIPGDGLAHGNGANGFAEELVSIPSPLIAGYYFRIEFTIANMGGGETVQLRGSAVGTVRSTNGTFVEYLLATGAELKFRGGGSGFTGTIDNVSVRKLTGGFDIRANLDVGDGSTSTWFDMGDDIAFFETGYSLDVKANATLVKSSISFPSDQLTSYPMQSETVYPAVGDVEETVTFGNDSEETGTFAVPSEDNVTDASYGAGGTEFTGNRTDAPENKVTDASYGVNGTGLVGNRTDALEADVRAKVLYGPNGTGFEGELGAAWGGGGDGALSVPAAIAALISADPQLASLLGRWDFGDGEAPAVFTVDPAPIDCPNPVIIIVQDGGVPNSVRGFRGLDLSGTITVWGDKTGSDRLMAQIAHLLWKLLARANPILSDYNHEGLIVGAGQKTDDPEGFSGYILNWNLTIAEQ